MIHCVEHRISLFQNNSYNYAIIKFFTGYAGKIRSISGFEQLEKYKNKKVNIEGSPFVNIGDEVNDPTTDGDRLGYLMGWGTSRRDVHNIFQNQFIKIKFECSL